MDFTPSLEQLSIVDAIKKGENVKVDCVAGSGKTTTVFLLAQECSNKKILQVTYNKELKNEVREKASKMNITNLEVHTYHSLVVKYYDHKGYDDAHIRKVIKNDLSPKVTIPSFDILVIDECQDMTMLFFRLIQKFIINIKKYPTLLILGDKYQSIYKFKDADYRFLTLAEKIYNRPFISLTLSTSFRLTKEISDFVNTHMLGYNKIKTIKEGPKVEFIKSSAFQVQYYLFDCIEELINDKGIKADDIFVLSPSIRSSNSIPCRRLENMLVENDIPCFYPISDESKLDDIIIKGKVVFSTFHQAKGRERKVVIVYGFDDGYFNFYARDENRFECPDTLYVAATRAKEYLYLIEGDDQGRLSFLKSPNNFHMNVKYIELTNCNRGASLAKPNNNASSFTTCPSELVKFLKEENIRLLTPLIELLFRKEKDGSKKANIPSTLKSKISGLSEDITDINGLCIPSIYEKKINGISSIERLVKNSYETCDSFFKKAIEKLPQNIDTFSDHVYLTIIYSSISGMLYNKLAQIDRYDWLKKDEVEICFSHLENNISKDVEYENDIEITTKKFPEYASKIEISGRLDTEDDKNIFEIKCVEKLTLEHFLQVCIYAWMWDELYDNKKTFKLLNIRDGERHVLLNNPKIVEEVIKILLENKYGKKLRSTDEEFISYCNDTKSLSFKNTSNVIHEECMIE